jgi:Kef-type K+ transport system membrane component KefB
MQTTFSELTILGGATLLGHYLGKLSKALRLPSVIGYMILGIVLGSSVLDLLDSKTLKDFEFINNIVLGLVAFGIGAELNLKALRKLGFGIISIILAESFGAFLMVTGLIYFFTGDLPMAIIYGAIAPASAPAGTVAVIQENKTRGKLTKALYAVVGFDDGLAIIIFGFAFAVAKNLLLSEAPGAISPTFITLMLPPVKEIVISCLLGICLGLIFLALIRKVKTQAEMLVVIFGLVFIGTGISVHHHLSLFLTNMAIGFIFANAINPRRVHQVMISMSYLMPLFFIWFFSLAGAHLDLAKLPNLGLIGLLYIVGRTFGLIGGAMLGGLMGGADEKVKKWVGFGILSQAGVAIGLTMIVTNDFAAMNLPRAQELGPAIITSITATCVFFEIVGPIGTKWALKKAGEIPQKRTV